MTSRLLRGAAQVCLDTGYLIGWLASKVEDRTAPRRFRRQLDDVTALARFLEGIQR